MSRFDYVLSNPPYQDSTSARNLYVPFIVLGSRLAENSAMIHPARAFVASTRAAQADLDHIMRNGWFTVNKFTHDATIIFPHVDIQAGIMITLYDKQQQVEHAFDNMYLPDEVLSVLNKVAAYHDDLETDSLMESMHSNTCVFSPYALEHYSESTSKISRTILTTSVLEKIPELFTPYDAATFDSATQTIVLGRERGKRVLKMLDTNMLVSKTFDKWKVFLPASSGAAKLGESDRPVQLIGATELGSPDMTATQTFISAGLFDTREEAEALQQYIHTRFVRLLVGAHKKTQHNSRYTWRSVPLQDFTNASDIDWTVSVDAIDEQLYDKYGVIASERQWIADHIAAME